MIQRQFNTNKNVQTINEIIEIEIKAQELIKTAKNEQSELPLKISEILDKYKIQQHEKALAKIEQVRAEEEKAANERIAKIHKEHEEKLSRLKNLVDKNIDSWTKKIYAFITTPTDI